ncbi:glycosyltransferase family 2 protein [Tellurirhabdus bombi]|uniref:glycosyltransferase family 2 protein n=1 Tax=Tellurirhabdus bombi TaxID=2907205 RepID=UPI001F336939|nr:glycosyltransferase family 2 protein [Tellurirhabdus bombi]
MIKVSVNIVTYNQVRFIAEAIESALNQETTFPYEIIVADDCSTDGAREVIEAYQKKYPDKIRAILHEKNLGGAGKFNAISAIEASRGQYIATTDGDDYFTSPHKLQKQVEFMDAHPECSTCFHNAQIIWEDGSYAPELVNGPEQKLISTVEDLVGEDEVWFMATSSVMFRNGLLTDYPDWFYESKSGDIPRYILLAKKGKIGYLPDVMSVYRKNRDGVSFTDHRWDADFLYNRIGMYEGINRELDYRFDRVLRKNIARYYRMMLDSKQYEGRYFPRASIALKYLNLGRPNWHITKEIVRDYLVPESLLKVYSAIRLLPHRN